ncbi:MAG: methyltransferase domain-containing protein [Bacteroidia bacterium]
MPSPPKPLLDRKSLERSAVVANNRMNRERNLHGVNSYQKELGFDFLAWLRNRPGTVHWMDLCCGKGNALIHAAHDLAGTSDASRIHLEGLDLVGMFSPIPEDIVYPPSLQIGSVAEWQPTVRYDLITCIHGIHYLGDKLGAIRHSLLQLKDDGLLAINLDPRNLKDENGNTLEAFWKSTIRQKGWTYNARRHLLMITGRQDWPETWQYLGADDQAGPNYSGQPVVDSYYQMGG